MDIINDWSDRISHEQLERVLELGEALQLMPIEHRCLRLVLMASKLAGDGVARSQEEAYVMLMEAYAHAEIMSILNSYDATLKEYEVFARQFKKDYMRLMKENIRLKLLLQSPVIPERRPTVTVEVDEA